MLDGFKNTIIITLGALAISIVLGSLIAVIRYLGEDVPAMKPIVKVLTFYVNVIRGIPVVVLLLIFYFVIMKASEGLVVGIITFGINSSAYMSELIRGGINSVDKGQMEAGRSLGMSRLQCTRRIIFPQAIRYILPAVGNELIALLKETSVAGYVAVVDLTRAGNLVRNNTYDAVNPLLLVAITYLIMVFGLDALLRKMERRLARNDKR
ncbi:MAG: amino acid ABC transporter permease [Lachnospiraceae bacterium]|nr:amino acid ABC transporter permease [Lachnospiraceae bacterium]